MDDLHPDVRAALMLMERSSREEADDARAALEWLVGEGGPGDLTQARLQEFLWYSLPRKWLTDAAHHKRVAVALGEALELLGMPRYAEVCRSEVTREILMAWERDDSEGFEAFRRARERSGLEPPDTDDLEWASTMGPDEFGLTDDIAATLEASVAAGDLRPGARGWKVAQRAITVEWLHRPQAGLDGSTPVRVIRLERVDRWLGTRPMRRSLLAPVVSGLVDPPPPSEATLESVEPLRWLLERIGDGVALTQTGNLNARLVQETTAAFGWWTGLRGIPRSELEVHELIVLHDLARSMRAVRRKGRRELLTRAGVEMAGDRERLWRSVCRALTSRDGGFDAAAATLVLAILLREARPEYPDLSPAIHPVLEETGWHRRGAAYGSGLDVESASWGVAAALRPLRVLGSIEEGRWPERWVSLTEAGRATAVQALSAAATAPGRFPLGG